MKKDLLFWVIIRVFLLPLIVFGRKVECFSCEAEGGKLWEGTICRKEIKVRPRYGSGTKFEADNFCRTLFHSFSEIVGSSNEKYPICGVNIKYDYPVPEKKILPLSYETPLRGGMIERNSCISSEGCSLNKVFLIGFRECGDVLLHNFFQLGNVSIHRGLSAKKTWQNYVDNELLLPVGDESLVWSFFYENPGFFGFNLQFFQILDKEYPHSKFILNVEEFDRWIQSMQSMDSGTFIETFQHFHNMTKSEVVEFWERTWNQHMVEVKQYFRDRPTDLLIHNPFIDPVEDLTTFLLQLNLDPKNWGSVYEMKKDQKEAYIAFVVVADEENANDLFGGTLQSVSFEKYFISSFVIVLMYEEGRDKWIDEVEQRVLRFFEQMEVWIVREVKVMKVVGSYEDAVGKGISSLPNTCTHFFFLHPGESVVFPLTMYPRSLGKSFVKYDYVKTTVFNVTMNEETRAVLFKKKFLNWEGGIRNDGSRGITLIKTPRNEKFVYSRGHELVGVDARELKNDFKFGFTIFDGNSDIILHHGVMCPFFALGLCSPLEIDEDLCMLRESFDNLTRSCDFYMQFLNNLRHNSGHLSVSKFVKEIFRMKENHVSLEHYAILLDMLQKYGLWGESLALAEVVIEKSSELGMYSGVVLPNSWKIQTLKALALIHFGEFEEGKNIIQELSVFAPNKEVIKRFLACKSSEFVSQIFEDDSSTTQLHQFYPFYEPGVSVHLVNFYSIFVKVESEEFWNPGESLTHGYLCAIESTLRVFPNSYYHIYHNFGEVETDRFFEVLDVPFARERVFFHHVDIFEMAKNFSADFFEKWGDDMDYNHYTDIFRYWLLGTIHPHNLETLVGERFFDGSKIKWVTSVYKDMDMISINPFPEEFYTTTKTISGIDGFGTNVFENYEGSLWHLNSAFLLLTNHSSVFIQSVQNELVPLHELRSIDWESVGPILQHTSFVRLAEHKRRELVKLLSNAQGCPFNYGRTHDVIFKENKQVVNERWLSAILEKVLILHYFSGGDDRTKNFFKEKKWTTKNLWDELMKLRCPSVRKSELHRYVD